MSFDSIKNIGLSTAELLLTPASTYLQNPAAYRFYDSTDTSLQYVIDATGNFAQIATYSITQRLAAVGGGPVMADVSGNLVDRYGKRLSDTIPSLAVQRTPALSMWFPFSGVGTKSRLFDRAGYIQLTNSAVAGGVTLAQQAAVAVAITTGVITETAHPLKNGDAIILQILTGSAGMTSGKLVFVTNATVNTYTVANAPNGATITVTTAGTAIRYSVGRNANPGAQFNGSDYLQTSITQQWALQQAIMRLDTLKEDGTDAIVVYMELTHGLGTPGGDTQLFFFGRRNAVGGGQGWGISSIQATAQVKLQLDHCAAGSPSNTLSSPIGSGFALQGDFQSSGGSGLGINTRSAVCLSISKMPKTQGVGPSTADQGNAGAGAGLFYIEIAKAGLTDIGFFGQQNRTISTPPRLVAGATGVAGVCDAALTIGMSPGNSPTTVVKPMIAGQGIDNLIFQRRKRLGGLVCTAVRQGQRNYQANPFAQPVQPACLAV